MGTTTEASTPDWPKRTTAPKGAPNIVIIMLDDVGFAASSTFGGLAQTPVLSKLAARGLRYNNFNTTALCSPTRAALLTGRNHHRVGYGVPTEIGGGYPGYDGRWPKSAASVATVLRENGFSTAAFGKWHNTPPWETSPVGPFDQWPTSEGFEYFYGFVQAADDQWHPSLYRGTTPVEPAKMADRPYSLTADLATDAIGWLHTHQSLAPDKPYFLYFATGATHYPHQVPKAWIEKYRGKFDTGWDKLREEIFARQKKLGVIPADADLTPRPDAIPAWDSLSAVQKKVYARQMEVYAAFLAYTDHEIGRLLKTINDSPQANNTLIFYIVGDNGSEGGEGIDGMMDELDMFSQPKNQLPHLDELGGPKYINNYSAGWAWADTTPFQWFKTIASHFGGVRNPLVVSWPAHIKDDGGLRSQFTHVNDIVPTIYDVVGITAPSSVDGVKQMSIDGASFAYSFAHADAPSSHHVQYFEMRGNRAIYKDGWIAAAFHSLPWGPRNKNFSRDRWELYHVAADFSEAHDLASKYPARLKKLQKLFDSEAKRNNVYPLMDRSGNVSEGGRSAAPSLTAGRDHFVYYPDLPRLRTTVIPNFQKSHRIEADVVIPREGAEGVVISAGAVHDGFVLYVKDDHLVYENNFDGVEHDQIRSNIVLPRGKVTLGYEFSKEGTQPLSGGTARLYINGKPVGEAELAHVGPASYFGSFGIGRTYGSPVSSAYSSPFRFTGELEKVTVDIR